MHLATAAVAVSQHCWDSGVRAELAWREVPCGLISACSDVLLGYSCLLQWWGLDFTLLGDCCQLLGKEHLWLGRSLAWAWHS